MKKRKKSVRLNNQSVREYYTYNGTIIDLSKYPANKETRYVNRVLGEEVNTEKCLPKLYLRREDCCGCWACYSICPVCSIIMEEDEEGFEYPVVDASTCVKCHKCEYVCPIGDKR